MFCIVLISTITHVDEYEFIIPEYDEFSSNIMKCYYNVYENGSIVFEQVDLNISYFN